MARAQYADVIDIGNLQIRGRLVPVARSKSEPLTKTVHVTPSGEIHQVNQDPPTFSCKSCGNGEGNNLVASDEIGSAVEIDNRLIVLSKEDEEKTKPEKGLVFTDKIAIDLIRIWEAEKFYFFEPDPSSIESVRNARAIFFLLERSRTAYGGDLIVNNVTRRSFLIPMQGRLFLVRFHYGEDLNKEPAGSLLLTPPTDEDGDRVIFVAKRIGPLRRLSEHKIDETNPKRLALRDRAKMALLRTTKVTT